MARQENQITSTFSVETLSRGCEASIGLAAKSRGSLLKEKCGHWTEPTKGQSLSEEPRDVRRGRSSKYRSIDKDTHKKMGKGTEGRKRKVFKRFSLLFRKREKSFLTLFSKKVLFFFLVLLSRWTKATNDTLKKEARRTFVVCLR